jgi:Tol biopolymer transport system component
MSLAAGTRLGPYEIVSPLGAGGMGEVYRARDTKLNREVALKILPDGFATDPDRLARFRREAQVLAALNHPNIAHIHGYEDTGATHALVMELVEGPTLADRIKPGPMTLADALAIARQIADALEAAHELGIVHRDLKPANVKVRDDGTVKVLDFGLAKALGPAAASEAAAALANSPTVTRPALTERGVILGTAAYMSPEQAAGQAVDKRSDLWGFGVVLLEMLTGRRVFAGPDVVHVLAAVLKSEPDWTALPAETPPAVRRLLRRCLEKDPKRRWRDIGDARLELDEAASPSDRDDAVAVISGTTPVVPAWRRALPWALAASGLAAALVFLLLWSPWRPALGVTPVYSTVDAPADYVLGDDAGLSLPTRTPMVFTPDGLALIILGAHGGKTQLFLRRLDHPDAQPIVGSEGAHVPFVSPDGRWVGFTADGVLQKVPIEGGTPTTICPLTVLLGPDGAAWGGNDVIVFGDDRLRRIMRVQAGGGTPVPVTAQAPSGRRHVTPFLLPDGKRVLFSDVSTHDANDANLMVQGIDGGEARLVLRGATDGRLLPSGRLAFMHLGKLLTIPFDVTRAEVSGAAVAEMDHVMQSGLRAKAYANNTGAGMYAVSNQGAVAFIRGDVAGGEGNSLWWETPDGRSLSAETASGAPTGNRISMRISPDGSRAAMTVITATRWELWVVDWARHVWTQCTDCEVIRVQAVWSPSGRQLLLSRGDALLVHAFDGGASDREVLREPGHELDPGLWLRDGRIIYLSKDVDGTGSAIKVLEPGASAGTTVVPLGRDPDLSPDGHWLAYESARPDRDANVYVRAFPGLGTEIQVSAGFGINPAWSADGRTLYYIGAHDPSGGAVFGVDLAAAGGTMTAGQPRELFPRPTAGGCAPTRCYDFSQTEKRFLFGNPSDVRRPSVTRLELTQNWPPALPKRR